MFLKDLGTKKNHGRSKSLSLMATSMPWLTDGKRYDYLHRLRNTINCSRPRGPRVKAPPSNLPILSLRIKLSATCAAEGTWEVCLGLLLREGTCQKNKRISQQHPLDQTPGSEGETQHEWTECSTGAAQKSVQAAFFRVLGANRHFFHGGSSEPARRLAVPSHQSVKDLHHCK